MKRYILFLIIFCSLFCVACGGNGLAISDPSELFPDENAELNKVSNDAADASSFDAGNAEGESIKDGCVYICGAVEKPGIYEFSKGTRLYELIEEAGGLDEEADADAINLAMEVSDAMQIRIPYIGEKAYESDEELIDINSADVSRLCSIPGIGESRANAIIDYREKNGGFKDVEELKNISGIKDATFNKIKPYVCVR